MTYRTAAALREPCPRTGETGAPVVSLPENDGVLLRNPKDIRPPLVHGVDFWRSHVVALTEAHKGLRPHLNTVARRCREMAQEMKLSPSEVDMVTVAGYTHDVGKVPQLAHVGWHPLDGANYLYKQGEGRLANLVAHHSGARYEAMLLGHERELARFPREQSLIADLLMIVDLTTRQDGIVTSVDDRLADMEARYGREAIPVRALHVLRPELDAAIERVEHRRKNPPQPQRPRSSS